MGETSTRSDIQFEQFVHQLVVPTFVVGADGRVLVWNLACERLTGMSATDVVGTTDHWRAFYPYARPCLADLIVAGNTDQVESLYASTDASCEVYGGLHAENWCSMPLRNVRLYLSIDAGPIYRDGKLVGVIETLRDWTDWKTAESQLRLIESVFDSSSEGIFITDSRGIILKVNPAYSRLTGYAVGEAVGRNPRFMQSGIHDRAFYEDFWYRLDTEGCWAGEIWNRRRNGEVFPENLTVNVVRDRDGKAAHYVAIFSDITSVKQVQERLEDMATHDALTGLPNRIGLSVRLHQVLAAARNNNRLVAVCFVDLDGFKPVNDNFGHEVGDLVLVEIAQRLRTVTRTYDTVARIGGDEFVMLLAEFSNIDEIEIALERILETLRRPIQVEMRAVVVSASIGVTVHPLDESDTDTLIRHADQAMYAAKNMGRNTWRMYDIADEVALQQASSLQARVREGLRLGEFQLYYQPKTNLRTGHVVGMEALVRWLHPERGLVPPGDFLPHIENTPLIVEFGEWVFHEALQQVSRWLTAGLRLRVSVNVAARQFQHLDFVIRLRNILAQYPDVSPSLLEIEVLESTALDDVENVRAVVLACREIGVGIALDDFGTGYSTLTYLKRLPAQELKIDRSFVHDMLEDEEDLALIEGVIGLASVFHMGVVAEGVETLEQGIVLMRIGCDVVQGYYIAKPMPAAEVVSWCAAFSPDPVWQEWAASAWERVHLPLVLAEYDHLKWVQRLTVSLDDPAVKLSSDEVADPHACRFGQWYASDGRRQYGHLPAFAEIDPLHHRIHTLARQMVSLRDAGLVGAARAHLDELLSLKDAIVARLGILHRALFDRGGERPHT